MLMSGPFTSNFNQSRQDSMALFCLCECLFQSAHVHCTGTSCTATVGPGGKRDIYVRTLHLKFQPIPLRFHGLIWPLRMPIPERACSLHGNQLHCHRGTWWEKRYLCQDPSPQISASSVQIPWPYLAFALT